MGLHLNELKGANYFIYNLLIYFDSLVSDSFQHYSNFCGLYMNLLSQSIDVHVENSLNGT
jgi:hypothetical protein